MQKEKKKKKENRCSKLEKIVEIFLLFQPQLLNNQKTNLTINPIKNSQNPNEAQRKIHAKKKLKPRR